jgi:hypothetical protein
MILGIITAIITSRGSKLTHYFGSIFVAVPLALAWVRGRGFSRIGAVGAR